MSKPNQGSPWLWSYGSWIDSYLCNQCLFITNEVLSSNCDRLVVFSEYSVSFTNEINRHDIAEILLKVALNTIA